MIVHGGTVFYVYTVVLFLFLFFHIIAGYRLYESQKTTLELEHKYKLLYDKSSDGIALIKNSKIIECNEALLKMFGYEDDFSTFSQTNVSKLSPDYQDKTESKRMMLLFLRQAKKGKITFEWLHKHKNGNEFWVEITLQNIIINNENVIHGIWRDINDRKLAETEIKELNFTLDEKVRNEVEKNRKKDQQLIQQSRLAQMGEMISMIAHQWRQPLSAISARANSIKIKILLGDTIDNSLLSYITSSSTL
jgi:PAS domain S-box-containing protein